MDAALIETLSSFVPSLIVRRLVTNPEPNEAALVDTFSAAVLFADITGFTPLTERLVRRGPAGVEELSTLLNEYFGRLIDLIMGQGGEVVKFAGDGLLALWPTITLDEDLETVTRRAGQCGLLMQTTVTNDTASSQNRLSLRIGVGAGDVWTAQLGGVLGRWELAVTGEALVQISAAHETARPGDVVLSPQAAAALPATMLDSHLLDAGHYRLQAIYDWLPPPTLTTPTLPPHAEAALKAYIPGAVIQRLAAGLSGWLAEFRPVTVIFINLPDLNQAQRGILPQAQNVMRMLQTAVYQYEGSVNKLSVDDKGANLLAAFGLPPLAHEDDAVRGIRAVLNMQRELEALDLRYAIGVTTGRAFCGVIGNARRREYSIIGDVPNMAARLMQAAASGDVLCDEETMRAAQNHFAFDSLPSLAVKGKEEPVAVYRPQAPLRTVVRPQTSIVGRIAERLLFVDQLQTLLRGGPGGTILMEGENGIGKTRLVDELLEHARILNVRTLIGRSQSIEKSIPHYAWRAVFNQYFDLENKSQPPAELYAQLLNSVQESPELVELLPLLNGILPLDLPENEITMQMRGQVRAHNIHAVLIYLLQRLTRHGPLLLVFDDAQWLDSASWSLLRLVSRTLPTTLIVVATRPWDGTPPVEYRQLRKAPGTHFMRLDVLPDDDVLELVCQRLGVASLPPPVAQLILEKAEGHPFFSEELAYALRDTGVLVIENGRCTLAADAGELQDLGFPNTVQGVITSRIDSLAPAQQLTLKVASVIGRAFEYRTLRYIHPIEDDKRELPNHLRQLERLRIMLKDPPKPHLSYVFRHIITQEVAYSLMLHSQRQRLHRAVAEWYEKVYADDLAPFYVTLAYHWQQAGVAASAVDYLEQGGTKALWDGAFEEAIELFDQALNRVTETETAASPTAQPDTNGNGRTAVIPSSYSTISPLRQARWQRQLGQAFFGLGNLSKGAEHLYQALSLLNQPIPVTNARLIASLIGQFVRQLFHRLRPGKLSQRQAEASERLLEAVRAYELLGMIYYINNQAVPFVYAGFRTLNLAEQAGLYSSELAQAYANVGLVLGITPFRRMADLYLRRAWKIAQDVNQLPALQYVALLTGLYKIGVARWQEANSALDKMEEISRRLGDNVRLGQCLTGKGLMVYYQGNLGQAAALFNAVYEIAHDGENVLHEAWGLSGKAAVVLRRGDLREAAELAQRALQALAKTADLTEEIRCYVTLALSHLRQGAPTPALAHVETAVTLLHNSTSPPTGYFLLDTYATIAEIYLALWESGSRPQQELAPAARQACKALRNFARTFPVGRPAALLYGAMADWLDGRRQKAHHGWQECLRVAGEMEMRYEQGLAHYRLGKHGADAQQQHLAAARECFVEMGATYELALVEAEKELLDASPSQENP